MLSMLCSMEAWINNFFAVVELSIWRTLTSWNINFSRTFRLSCYIMKNNSSRIFNFFFSLTKIDNSIKVHYNSNFHIKYIRRLLLFHFIALLLLLLLVFKSIRTMYILFIQLQSERKKMVVMYFQQPWNCHTQ